MLYTIVGDSVYDLHYFPGATRRRDQVLTCFDLPAVM